MDLKALSLRKPLSDSQSGRVQSQRITSKTIGGIASSLSGQTPELIKSLSAAAAAVALGAAAVAYAVYDRDAIRRQPSEVDQARTDMSVAAAELGRLQGQPKLPPLASQWIALSARVKQSCGLSIEPVVRVQDAPPPAGHYQGNANAWHGRIRGLPLQTVSCARVMATEFAVVIGTITQTPESSELLFSLLGSTTPTQ